MAKTLLKMTPFGVPARHIRVSILVVNRMPDRFDVTTDALPFDPDRNSDRHSNAISSASLEEHRLPLNIGGKHP